MKKKLKRLLIAGVLLWLAYIATQQPEVWLNHNWAGLRLERGGQRYWAIHFCDGAGTNHHIFRPNVYDWDRIDEGHGWPAFSHRDFRRHKTNPNDK